MFLRHPIEKDFSSFIVRNGKTYLVVKDMSGRFFPLKFVTETPFETYQECLDFAEQDSENETVVAHIAEGATLPTYHVFGQNVEMFVVNENANNGERVHAVSHEKDKSKLAELLSGQTVRSKK